MSRATLCRAIVYGALLGTCLVALATPLYNRGAPRLFGLPFFVWFQILWVIVSAAAIGLAYRFMRR